MPHLPLRPAVIAAILNEGFCEGGF